MSIVSTVFLFLFLPISVLIYYLIPKNKNLYFRNLFLVIVSLIFYAWGEPYYVFLLIFLMLFVHIAGKLVDGKKNTVFGKIIVFLIALTGIALIIYFKDKNYYLTLIGKLLHFNFSSREEGTPIGMTFFIFFAVSYIVDIYRGKFKSPESFLSTALYLSAFFKITQGPIIEYNQFEPQMLSRRVDINVIYKGIKRFLIGLAKKMLIASSISNITVLTFSENIGECSVVSVWLGCIAYLLEIYFDFSGYTDMACGMALLFGFKLPENFNYPYVSHSVAEYWQRWHMTLIQWFKDYLYYPIILGPSVRFRKFLLRHNVNKKTAKKLQNIVVPACIWIPTALWHGTNINYLLWGLLNCAICIIEMNINSAKNSRIKSAFGWIYTILFLILTKPLVLTGDIGSAWEYYCTMFGLRHIAFFNDMTLLILKEYGVFLALGILFCFPVRSKAEKHFKKLFESKIYKIVEGVALVALSVASIAFVIKTGSAIFIYQMF